MFEVIMKWFPFFNNLRKDIPDSICYEIYSDNHFTIPRELREFIRNSEIYSLKSTLIRIDNYSLKSKKNIRVIYSGNWEFSPDISYRRREGVDVNYKIIDKDKEIIIDEILPNESVYIFLYNTSSKFVIDQILFDDSEVTKTMQLLTEIKRYPELFKLKIYTFILCLLSVVTLIMTGGSIYFIYDRYNMVERHQAMIDDIANSINSKFDGCYIQVYETKKPSFEDAYNKNKWSEYETLKFNKVSNTDELKAKQEVVLCLERYKER